MAFENADAHRCVKGKVMAVSVLIVALAVSTQAAPTQFNRVYTKGERAEYRVHSVLNAEIREAGLDTWIPSDLDLMYNFSYEVSAMKSDGICVMRYKRPTMTQIDGETMERGPKTSIEKINMDYELTVSPINEILDMKDLAAKKPKPKPTLLKSSSARALSREAQNPFSTFVAEIYRMALFVGSIDSSLDFAPSLSFDEVRPGDTWKKTVGFSPQKLKDKDGKHAVQRLDYEYTYKGPVTVSNKRFLRIEGKLDLKTDLLPFIHQVYQVTSKETGLKEVPMTFSAKIDFDLDPKTHQTMRASGRSEGGFRVMAANLSQAVHEEKFKSTTSLSLVSHKR